MMDHMIIYKEGNRTRGTESLRKKTKVESLGMFMWSRSSQRTSRRLIEVKEDGLKLDNGSQSLEC